jgi:hypothetical protein
MSSTFNNFFAQAMIPCSSDVQAEIQGLAATNIDGATVRGGTLIGGTSGLQLASMGGPQAVCAALPLFAAGNQRYSQMGWTASRNINPLRVSLPLL